MIIPDYWDEHRETRKIASLGKKRVSRFGWSDVNQKSAKTHAKARVEEAFKSLEEGKDIELREKRVSYNGSDGMPIREEIVQFHGDAIVSRNIYGALCLNTPNILFADVDFGENAENKIGSFWTWLVFIAGVLQYNYAPNLFYDFSWNYLRIDLQYFTSEYFNEANPGMLLAIFGFVSWLTIFLYNQQFNENDDKFKARATTKAIKSIEAFSKDHPSWNLRVYRTHSGIRIMVLNDLFEPNSPEVLQFFEASNTDPMYVSMCQMQNCFRARVSPKPWRMNFDKPKGGIWPIKDSKMEKRRDWVSRYVKISKNYRSCFFVKEIGSGKVHEKCETLRALHDEYCKVDQEGLELA